MYAYPSGPWTWLAYAGRGGGKAAEKQAAVEAEAEAAARAAPQQAYDWKKDLEPDAGAAVKKEGGGADRVPIKEEAAEQPAAKVEAAPPKRKKPKFL